MAMFSRLKDKFAHKPAFSHNLLPLLLMQSQVEFCSLQNIPGASQQNSVAAFSYTTEVDRVLLLKKKKKRLHKAA